MDRIDAMALMNALGQPTRLAVFSLLARRGPSGVPASGIAEELGIARNLMSAHLAILSKAGLVEQRRSGKNQIYRAVPARAAALSGYLANLAAAGV